MNTHTAERPATCDLIRGNKSTALFPRIKSQAAGRSAPPRCMCVRTLRFSCWISKATRTHARACTRSRSWAPAHTHTQMCNTYCFSKARMVTCTRLSVTLYVHYLSCSVFHICSLCFFIPLFLSVILSYLHSSFELHYVTENRAPTAYCT